MPRHRNRMEWLWVGLTTAVVLLVVLLALCGWAQLIKRMLTEWS